MKWSERDACREASVRDRVKSASKSRPHPPPRGIMSLSWRGDPRWGRERKAQRERDAELDKLTVQARLATVGARKLTAAVLAQLYDELLDQAMNSTGHVKRQAIETVFRLAQLAVEGDDDPEGVAWADMTPAQRAAARAIVEKELAELAKLAETGEQHEQADARGALGGSWS
jgi:rubrerythrin